MYKFNSLGLNGPGSSSPGFSGPVFSNLVLSSPALSRSTLNRPALHRPVLNRSVLSSLLLGLAVCFLPAVSWAQNNAPGELEEVIVTAQFREAPLMQTSGSISVMDQTALFDRGALHLQDALNVLPNVNAIS